MKTRGRTITVTDTGDTIVMTGYQVADIARRAGLRPIYSGVSHGWVTDAHRLADLLAFCQSRRIAVTVVSEEDRDLHAEEDRDLHGRDDPLGDEHRGHDHLDLFGGEVA